MKQYNVYIDKGNDIETFTISAINLKDARKIASFNKRMTGSKGRLHVRLKRTAK